MPPVVHPILQRCEEGIGHCVVVAVAGAAAGQADVVGADPLGEEPAGVLRAAVGMEYGVARHVSARSGGSQRRPQGCWIGNPFLDKFQRVRPAFLNSTGLM